MSIDELLGLSVDELEKLTDEELLTRYAPIFQLEPAVPLVDVPETDNEEAEEATTPKVKKKKESKAKLQDLKNKLMEASKAGLSKDEAFDKLFDL
jgi:nitrate reductase assembly molybdenum cofactor insertion protein NarJ